MKLDFQVPNLPMSESVCHVWKLSELRFGGADPCIRSLIATVSYAVNVTPFFHTNSSGANMHLKLLDSCGRGTVFGFLGMSRKFTWRFSLAMMMLTLLNRYVNRPSGKMPRPAKAPDFWQPPVSARIGCKPRRSKNSRALFQFSIFAAKVPSLSLSISLFGKRSAAFWRLNSATFLRSNSDASSSTFLQHAFL